MSDVACVGEALIDMFAQSEIADVGSSEYFQRAAGGAVSNVAVGIARLGGKSAFVGTVGRDAFGRFLVRTLAHENVDVDYVRTVDAGTPLMFVARGAAGARDFFPFNWPGAVGSLSVDDLDRTMLENAKAVHLGGVLLAAEPSRSATMAAAAIAHKAGLVSFDLNVRTRLFSDMEDMRRAMLEASAAAHVVKVSDEDLRALGYPEDDASRLLAGATEAIVLTRGPHGCRWMTKDGRTGDVPAPRVDVVDTTGAGDAFVAAMLWRLLYHHHAKVGAETIAESVRWAVVAGSLACTKLGAIASLPRSTELAALVGQEHA